MLYSAALSGDSVFVPPFILCDLRIGLILL